jgi:hypothetical protein
MAAWGRPPVSGDAVDAEPLAAPPARLRPGRVWYLVALAVIVAGVAWLLVGLAAFNGQIDSFQRVALPGDGEITLAHSGGYVIYYEGPGAAAGNAPVLTVRLRPLSASAAVQIITRSDSSSFSFGSHADTAVLNLQIAHPGRFLLQARAPAAPAGSRLAVGSGVGGSLARVIVPFIALIVVGVCGVVAVGFIRGSRGSRGGSSGVLPGQQGDSGGHHGGHGGHGGGGHGGAGHGGGGGGGHGGGGGGGGHGGG